MPHPLSGFLCTHCLHFGEVLYACPGCWEEVGVLRLRLNVGNLQACPCCYAALYPEAEVDRLAFCVHCQQVSDAQLRHLPGAVLGAFGNASFAWMCELMGKPHHRGGPCCVSGNFVGEEVALYLLDLATIEPQGPLDAHHAVRHLKQVYLDGAEVDALALGRIVDRYIQQARLNGGQRRTLEVLVRQAKLPAVVQNVLGSRLPHARYGMEGSREYWTGPGWVFEELSQHQMPPRVVAVTHE